MLKQLNNNCFLLLLPLLVWNLCFYSFLPDFFFNETSSSELELAETVLRIAVFGTPLFMRFDFKSKKSKLGFVLYLFGSLLYFLSWIMLIAAPESSWSQSTLGLMGPSLSPIIWLLGISLLSKKGFLNIPNLPISYAFVSFFFVGVHSWHMFMVLSEYKSF
jgi:hypothetical protein